LAFTHIQNRVPPTDDELTTEIREIIKKADLNTFTAKACRLILQDYFKVDLSHKKDVIDNIILLVLDENDNAENISVKTKEKKK